MPSVGPQKPSSTASSGSSPIAYITSRKFKPALRTSISTSSSPRAPPSVQPASGGCERAPARNTRAAQSGERAAARRAPAAEASRRCSNAARSGRQRSAESHPPRPEQASLAPTSRHSACREGDQAGRANGFAGRRTLALRRARCPRAPHRATVDMRRFPGRRTLRAFGNSAVPACAAMTQLSGPMSQLAQLCSHAVKTAARNSCAAVRDASERRGRGEVEAGQVDPSVRLLTALPAASGAVDPSVRGDSDRMHKCANRSAHKTARK